MKIYGDQHDATITDEDQVRIDAVLSFWFQERSLSAPKLDARMEVWFGEDAEFDTQIKTEFSGMVAEASAGELRHWTNKGNGRLALILLLDQFRRNIYRGTADAYAKDKTALKVCVEGALERQDRHLTPIQRVFFYMPLQHCESLKVQKRSVQIFNRLAEAVSPTYRETFETVAQFAELHHDIIERFGRFPHRNTVLKRKNTREEDEYLSGGDAETFGQSG